METPTAPYIHFLTDMDNRLHNLRLKILDAAENYFKNPSPENNKIVTAWAVEKLRIELKYGLKHE